jgi:adenine-specific DNA-methyltransferase
MTKSAHRTIKIDFRRRHFLHKGDCADLFRALPDGFADLIVSSPPYCMGKEYESSQDPADFLVQHQSLAPELLRILKPGGSLCWQVGNHVLEGCITPLDFLVLKAFEKHTDLVLRNRIIWTFGHGLHCKNRFSGRYESVLWFTKKGAPYRFNLDPVRVKQKYPGKRGYKGPNKGKLTSNPLGKNPGDVWEIPNVKGSHVEKTIHPCQFPIALVQRLILALTQKNGIVVDPFIGSGATACAAELTGRRCFGAEMNNRYHQLAHLRLQQAGRRLLRYRPYDRDLMRPDPKSKLAQNPFQTPTSNESREENQKAC